ncbi:MAG: hypothetical protein AB8G22_25710 [Saprospiraceae bacterium]
MRRISVLILLFNFMFCSVIFTQTNTNTPIKTEVLLQHETNQEVSKDLKYIKFQLKNNTLTRKHFYVRGPQGKRFSYGFPIGAQLKRAENWPVGTKVFKVNKIGGRKLIYTVKLEDEGQVIDLF